MTGRRPGGEAAIQARLAAAPGLTRAEGHWLAGLIEAEGHFSIHPNNAGQSWFCGFALALRDDDSDVLAGLQSKTGLGHLNHKPARGRSRPQLVWQINSRTECRALAELLEAYPLRGRKRREWNLWAQAVRLKHRPIRRDESDTGLAQLAAELTALRQFRTDRPRYPLALGDEADLLSFLGGFFTGEGSFGLSPRTARFMIKVRRDDRPLLELFAWMFDLGKVIDITTPSPWAPASLWVVCAQADVLRGIRLLEHAGLRGRKLRQYRAWRPGAGEFVCARIRGATPNAAVLGSSREALSTATEYRPPRAMPPSVDRASDAREVYLQIIREAARSIPGPLTATSYTRIRAGPHHAWPSRNTLVSAFGSWANALRAAGLGDRVAREYPNGWSAWSKPSPAERARDRDKVVAAVRQLAAQLERSPMASEYFAWRLDGQQELPSQATTYRLFPGGWVSVLEAASSSKAGEG